MNPKQPFPLVYHDGVSLYLEFDGHALRFTFSEAGLHKALKHIPNVTKAPGYLSGGRNIPNGESISGRIARKSGERKITKRSPTSFTDAQRDRASELIRKLKLGDPK